MKSKVRIQSSFVLSYLAIAVLAVATILLNNLSLPTIEADTVSTAGTRAKICAEDAPLYKGESTLSDQEKLNYGDLAKAWVVKQKQNKTFRVIVGARQVDAAGYGGNVEFTVALGNLNNEAYSESKGIIWLWVGENSTPLSFVYDWDRTLNLQPNNYWVGQKTTLINSYSDTKISFELVNGSGTNKQGCVSNALDLASVFPTPTPTATTTASASVTATATDTVTATTTATVTSTASSTPLTSWTIEKGFSVWAVSDSYTAVDGSDILNKGMYIYEFNKLGTQDWKIYSAGESLPIMYPGMGYYIYNPGAEAIVNLYSPSSVPTGISPGVMRRGWNLFANSSSSAFSLGQKTYSVIKSDSVSSCDGNSLCFESKTLNDLLSGGRVYGKIYLIADRSATEATKAFTVLNVDSSNADSLEIPSGAAYWIYLYK